MGVYDTVRVGQREGQVKIGDPQMHLLGPGERVPEEWGRFATESFSVVMREGGHVNVSDGVLVSWTDEPAHARVVDKYGDDWDPSAWRTPEDSDTYHFQRPPGI